MLKLGFRISKLIYLEFISRVQKKLDRVDIICPYSRFRFDDHTADSWNCAAWQPQHRSQTLSLRESPIQSNWTRQFIMFLEQIRYLYLPNVGLQLIASSGVNDRIQKSFLHDLVGQHWHQQDPLPQNYQAVYLYQSSPSDILFGWLFTESSLEGKIWPVFIGHYLPAILNSCLAEILFAFLSKGPMMPLASQAPTTLTKVIAPDLWDYQPQRSGVMMSSEERQHCHDAIRQGQCVNAFTFEIETQPAIAEINEDSTEQLIQVMMKYIGPIARITVWQFVEATSPIADPQQRVQELIQQALKDVSDHEKTACRQEVEGIFYPNSQTFQSQPPNYSEPNSQPMKWRGKLINL